MKRYKMPESLDMVGEFHATFQHPIEQKPLIPSENRSKLRISLLQEELDELKQAVENKDLTGIADALCDLQYVLSGAVLEFGMGGIFHQLFEEVQRSNMSKACDNLEEALLTIAHFREKSGTECYWAEKEGKYLVYRTEDQKTMKSVAYSPADLQKILNNHM
jgi:predicted HAD superfamily Cof-like phosphohydrolase